MDAVFDSSGNVAGNSGGNRLTAWTGQGLANLLAPSTSGIASAGSLLPDSSALGQAVRRNLSFSYPSAKVVDYARIAEEANNRPSNGTAGGLAEANYQKNLLNNAKRWLDSVNSNGDFKNAYLQGIASGNAMGGINAAKRNYDTAASSLSSLTDDEKAWLASQGVNVQSEYPAFSHPWFQV